MLHFTRSKAKPGRPGIISHLTLAPNDESLDKDLLPKLNIVSTGLASRKERQKLLAHAEQADIILVDEAHYARRKDPQKGCSIKPKYEPLSVYREILPQRESHVACYGNTYAD